MAFSGDSGSEFSGDDTRLDYGHTVRLGNFQNAIHPDCRKNQTPADGNTAANVASASAAGGHGNPLPVTKGEDF
jgi:hypothetical protein